MPSKKAAVNKARSKTEFGKYKEDVQTKIDTFKTKLVEKRKTAEGKLEAFESKLSAGATQIKNAFGKLFS